SLTPASVPAAAPVTSVLLPLTALPSCSGTPPLLVACGSPRCHWPVVAVSVPLGLVVQPVAVSKSSANTVVPGGGSSLPPPLSTNSNRFGEPVPGLVTTFWVASATSLSRICAGVQVGFAEAISAAAPATCGEAIDVPLMVLVAVLLLNQDEVIPTPGASRS